MKFTLTIELGNDAMRKYGHIREALTGVARTIYELNMTKPHIGDGHKVMDLNGNSVGEWTVSE